MALPASGQISIADLRNEFGTNYSDLNSFYRVNGITTPNNTGVPYSQADGTISLGQFHGAVRMTAGSWDQGTPGYYQIWVPVRNWLRIRLWGGGGNSNNPAGNAGGNSAVDWGSGTTNWSAIAYGGGAGGWNAGGSAPTPGGGGAAVGGNQENINGYAASGGQGGGSPYGGGGGAPGASNGAQGGAGAWPGGGSGGYHAAGSIVYGGGGGGGFVHSLFGANYSAQLLGIQVAAGAAATSTSPAGGNGRVLVEWGL